MAMDRSGFISFVFSLFSKQEFKVYHVEGLSQFVSYLLKARHLSVAELLM